MAKMWAKNGFLGMKIDFYGANEPIFAPNLAAVNVPKFGFGWLKSSFFVIAAPKSTNA